MTVQTECSTLDVPSRSAGELFQPLLGWFKNRLAIRQDRRDVKRLLDVNDHLLDDMGLDRADIRWALNSPSTLLPSVRLHALRTQRSRDRLARMRSHRR